MPALRLFFLAIIAAASSSAGSANADTRRDANANLSVGATVVDVCRFETRNSLLFDGTTDCGSHIAYSVTMGMPPARIVSTARRGEVSATVATAQGTSTGSDNFMTVTF